MSSGAELIVAERKRQIDVEGWEPSDDLQHGDSELAFAACYYALPCLFRVAGVTVTPQILFEQTGWNLDFAKRDKKSRIRRLAVAGALLAAEIDRLILSGEEVQS